ncbi:MAG: hypothetical protein M3377_01925 [Actinomycetota bacterium]|nr:hypothetical protein [Actinomycetota bacterium]
MAADTLRISSAMRDRAQAIAELTDAVCLEHLDEEYGRSRASWSHGWPASAPRRWPVATCDLGGGGHLPAALSLLIA